MQKLFKLDATKAEDKENKSSLKPNTQDMQQSHVSDRSKMEASGIAKSEVTKKGDPKTPAKNDKEFDDFESVLNGKTDAKSKKDNGDDPFE